MIKAVWLAVLCVVVFAAAAAISAGQAPSPATAEADTTTGPESTTVGASFAQDILPRGNLTQASLSQDQSSQDRSNPDRAIQNVSRPGPSGSDTLTKTDRLEIAPARVAVAAPPASAVTALPADTPLTTAPATTAPKTVATTAGRQRHDANAKMVAAPSPAPRDHHTEPKATKPTTVARANTVRANTSRTKTVSETRPCRRPDGFAGFLRSLNIGPNCAT